MSHANICHVYELDESDRQLFIVMEYLEGVTLLALLRKQARDQRPLDFGFIAGIVQQVSDGLHYAHELTDRDGRLLGIVHRDVTPSNIFLTETGVVKVHDFGVAKVKDAANTESGTVKGKFGYLAPEQIQGDDIDRRVDVFAFGIVIAEMVTNRRLFQRKTDYLTFRAVMEQPLPEIRRYRPDVPELLVQVLGRALARLPSERFATVRDLGAAVVDALAPLSKPWHQAQIAAFVRDKFEGEIREHHAEISAVVRTSRTTRSLPVILQTPSDSEEPDYLAIETSDEDDAPANPPTAPTPSPVPAAPTEAVASARSAWPLAIVIGGAGLVLLLGLLLVDRGASAAPSGAQCAVKPDHARGAYAEAIHREDARLAACAKGHDRDRATSLRTTVLVAADGHAERIVFDPAARDDLATCIRTVLLAIEFPPAATETELSIAVHR
jgi:serine/threonine protein kinase